MISLMASGGIALLVAALGTPALIRWLARSSIGQQIREDGPSMHLVKAGTPTMGGMAMVARRGRGLPDRPRSGPTWRFSRAGHPRHRRHASATAVIGFVDDWIKVRHQRSLGLNKRAKLAAQVVVALGFALAAEHWAGVNTHLSFTRFNSFGIDLGRWAGSCGPCSSWSGRPTP